MKGKKLFNKFIALTISVCLLVSITSADIFSAVFSGQMPQIQSSSASMVPLISPDNGKITSLTDTGSDLTVVNIQDLHCHPQTQKKISNIIEEINKENKIRQIYVEGGYGNIDVSWLKNINDEKLKEQIIEQLLVDGEITAVEYYATLKNNDVELKGLDEKTIHQNNIERLSKIMDNQQKYDFIIQKVKNEIARLNKTYINNANRKFSKEINKYKTEGGDSGKLYVKLFKYIDEINSNFDKYNNLTKLSKQDYPNISTYMLLDKESKKIKIEEIGGQIQAVLLNLKSKLSYGQYSEIISKTNNLKDINKLAWYINKYAYEKNINLNKYDTLNKFLEIRKLNESLNPVILLEEERELIEQIRLALSYDKTEYEITFINDFEEYFEGYLKYSLTSQDWGFVKKNFKNFRTIYAKYAVIDRIKEIEDDFDELDKYYDINDNRNSIFIKNILSDSPGITKIKNPGTRTVREIIKDSKEVIIVVAGGYHSSELSNMLSKKSVNDIVITPNITGDIANANNKYKQIISEQSLQTQALAFRLASCLENASMQQKMLIKAGIEILGNDENVIKELHNLFGIDIKYDKTNNEFTLKGEKLNLNDISQKKQIYIEYYKTIIDLSIEPFKKVIEILTSTEQINKFYKENIDDLLFTAAKILSNSGGFASFDTENALNYDERFEEKLKTVGVDSIEDFVELSLETQRKISTSIGKTKKEDKIDVDKLSIFERPWFKKNAYWWEEVVFGLIATAVIGVFSIVNPIGWIGITTLFMAARVSFIGAHSIAEYRRGESKQDIKQKFKNRLLPTAIFSIPYAISLVFISFGLWTFIPALVILTPAAIILHYYWNNNKEIIQKYLAKIHVIRQFGYVKMSISDNDSFINDFKNIYKEINSEIKYEFKIIQKPSIDNILLCREYREKLKEEEEILLNTYKNLESFYKEKKEQKFPEAELREINYGRIMQNKTNNQYLMKIINDKTLETEVRLLSYGYFMANFGNIKNLNNPDDLINKTKKMLKDYVDKNKKIENDVVLRAVGVGVALTVLDEKNVDNKSFINLKDKQKTKLYKTILSSNIVASGTKGICANSNMFFADTNISTIAHEIGHNIFNLKRGLYKNLTVQELAADTSASFVMQILDKNIVKEVEVNDYLYKLFYDDNKVYDYLTLEEHEAERGFIFLLYFASKKIGKVLSFGELFNFLLEDESIGVIIEDREYKQQKEVLKNIIKHYLMWLKNNSFVYKEQDVENLGETIIYTDSWKIFILEFFEYLEINNKEMYYTVIDYIRTIFSPSYSYKDKNYISYIKNILAKKIEEYNEVMKKETTEHYSKDDKRKVLKKIYDEYVEILISSHLLSQPKDFFIIAKFTEKIINNLADEEIDIIIKEIVGKKKLLQLSYDDKCILVKLIIVKDKLSNKDKEILKFLLKDEKDVSSWLKGDKISHDNQYKIRILFDRKRGNLSYSQRKKIIKILENSPLRYKDKILQKLNKEQFLMIQLKFILKITDGDVSEFITREDMDKMVSEFFRKSDNNITDDNVDLLVNDVFKEFLKNKQYEKSFYEAYKFFDTYFEKEELSEKQKILLSKPINSLFVNNELSKDEKLLLKNIISNLIKKQIEGVDINNFNINKDMLSLLAKEGSMSSIEYELVFIDGLQIPFDKDSQKYKRLSQIITAVTHGGIESASLLTENKGLALKLFLNDGNINRNSKGSNVLKDFIDITKIVRNMRSLMTENEFNELLNIIDSVPGAMDVFYNIFKEHQNEVDEIAKTIMLIDNETIIVAFYGYDTNMPDSFSGIGLNEILDKINFIKTDKNYFVFGNVNKNLGTKRYEKENALQEWDKFVEQLNKIEEGKKILIIINAHGGEKGFVIYDNKKEDSVFRSNEDTANIIKNVKINGVTPILVLDACDSKTAGLNIYKKLKKEEKINMSVSTLDVGWSVADFVNGIILKDKLYSNWEKAILDSLSFVKKESISFKDMSDAEPVHVIHTNFIVGEEIEKVNIETALKLSSMVKLYSNKDKYTDDTFNAELEKIKAETKLENVDESETKKLENIERENGDISSQIAELSISERPWFKKNAYWWEELIFGVFLTGAIGIFSVVSPIGWAGIAGLFITARLSFIGAHSIAEYRRGETNKKIRQNIKSRLLPTTILSVPYAVSFLFLGMGLSVFIPQLLMLSLSAMAFHEYWNNNEEIIKKYLSKISKKLGYVTMSIGEEKEYDRLAKVPVFVFLGGGFTLINNTLLENIYNVDKENILYSLFSMIYILKGFLYRRDLIDRGIIKDFPDSNLEQTTKAFVKKIIENDKNTEISKHDLEAFYFGVLTILYTEKINNFLKTGISKEIFIRNVVSTIRSIADFENMYNLPEENIIFQFNKFDNDNKQGEILHQSFIRFLANIAHALGHIELSTNLKKTSLDVENINYYDGFLPEFYGEINSMKFFIECINLCENEKDVETFYKYLPVYAKNYLFSYEAATARTINGIFYEVFKNNISKWDALKKITRELIDKDKMTYKYYQGCFGEKKGNEELTPVEYIEKILDEMEKSSDFSEDEVNNIKNQMEQIWQYNIYNSIKLYPELNEKIKEEIEKGNIKIDIDPSKIHTYKGKWWSNTDIIKLREINFETDELSGRFDGWMSTEFNKEIKEEIEKGNIEIDIDPSELLMHKGKWLYPGYEYLASNVPDINLLETIYEYYKNKQDGNSIKNKKMIEKYIKIRKEEIQKNIQDTDSEFTTAPTLTTVLDINLKTETENIIKQEEAGTKKNERNKINENQEEQKDNEKNEINEEKRKEQLKDKEKTKPAKKIKRKKPKSVFPDDNKFRKNMQRLTSSVLLENDMKEIIKNEETLKDIAEDFVNLANDKITSYKISDDDFNVGRNDDLKILAATIYLVSHYKELLDNNRGIDEIASIIPYENGGQVRFTHDGSELGDNALGMYTGSGILIDSLKTRKEKLDKIEEDSVTLKERDTFLGMTIDLLHELGHTELGYYKNDKNDFLSEFYAETASILDTIRLNEQIKSFGLNNGKDIIPLDLLPIDERNLLFSSENETARAFNTIFFKLFGTDIEKWKELEKQISFSNFNIQIRTPIEFIEIILEELEKSSVFESHDIQNIRREMEQNWQYVIYKMVESDYELLEKIRSARINVEIYEKNNSVYGNGWLHGDEYLFLGSRVPDIKLLETIAEYYEDKIDPIAIKNKRIIEKYIKIRKEEIQKNVKDIDSNFLTGVDVSIPDEIESQSNAAILPETKEYVEEQIAEGKNPLLIAFGVAIKEFMKVYGSDFVERHKDKGDQKAAGLLRNISYVVPTIVGVLSIVIGLLMPAIPLTTILMVFISSITATNITTHVIIDFKAIKTQKEHTNIFIEDVINKAKKIEEGEIISGYVVSGNIGNFTQSNKLKNTGLKTQTGDSIYYVETAQSMIFGTRSGAKPSEIAKVLNETKILENLIKNKSSSINLSGFHFFDFLSRKLLCNFTSFSIIVEDESIEGIKFEDGIIITDKLKTSTSQSKIKELKALSSIKRTVGYTMADKIIISLESINEIDKLKRTLEIWRARKVITQEQYDELGLNREKVSQLVDKGIILYVKEDNKDNKDSKNNITKITDCYTGEQIDFEEITKYITPQELQIKILTSDKALVIDIERLKEIFKDNKNRDPLVRYGVLEALIGNIKTAFSINQLSKKNVEELAYNISFENLPNSWDELEESDEIKMIYDNLSKDKKTIFQDTIKNRIKAKELIKGFKGEIGIENNRKNKSLEKLLIKMIDKQGDINIDEGQADEYRKMTGKELQEEYNKIIKSGEKNITKMMILIPILMDEKKIKTDKGKTAEDDAKAYRAMLSAA